LRDIYSVKMVTKWPKHVAVFSVFQLER